MSLWALTWPMFIELVLAFTLGFEDSFYLAKISDRAAAAVGALFPVFGICNMAFQTFAQSGASVASQLIGGERRSWANRTLIATILLNGALGATAASFFFVFDRRVGLWMGLSPEVYAPATEFLSLVGPMLFIQALRFAYASVINARGRTRWNMLAAAFVNVANLGLNHVLTRGTWGLPRLGVAGVAYSTIVAQSLGLIISATVVHTHLKLRWDLAGLWSDLRACVAPILRIAVPSVIEPLSFNFQQLVLVRIIIVLGDVALATRTYTMNLIALAIVWSFALGVGTQIKVAHFIGARRFSDAHAQLNRSLRIGMLLGFGMMGLLAFSAGPLYHLFTQDPEILRAGQVLLLFGLLLEPARTSNMVVGGSLRGSGDARFASFVSVALTWGMAIPLAYVLALRLGLGLVGVWLAMIADEASRGLMNYWRWQTGIWESKGVLAHEATVKA
jgi:putative MATE family efflux protein